MGNSVGIVVTVIQFFFLSMPAAACHPTGSMPVCTCGMPEAFEANGGKLS